MSCPLWCVCVYAQGFLLSGLASGGVVQGKDEAWEPIGALLPASLPVVAFVKVSVLDGASVANGQPENENLFARNRRSKNRNVCVNAKVREKLQWWYVVGRGKECTRQVINTAVSCFITSTSFLQDCTAPDAGRLLPMVAFQQCMECQNSCIIYTNQLNFINGYLLSQTLLRFARNKCAHVYVCVERVALLMYRNFAGTMFASFFLPRRLVDSRGGRKQTLTSE